MRDSCQTTRHVYKCTWLEGSCNVRKERVFQQYNNQLSGNALDLKINLLTTVWMLTFHRVPTRLTGKYKNELSSLPDRHVGPL